MPTRLLTPLAPGRGFLRKLARAAARRPAGLLLTGLGLFGATGLSHAQAPVIYGLGTLTAAATRADGSSIAAGSQGLVLLDPATGEASSPTGGTISVPGLPIAVIAPTFLTGVTAGQRIVGTDYRPNNGDLFALGYDALLPAGTANAQLYVLNTTSGAATPVGAALRLELGATDRVGFDFNPTVDRLRVTSAATQANYRLNPNDGTIVDGNPALAGVQPDGTLAYASGSPTPGIGAVAYLNSFVGSTATTLFDLDELNGGTLSIQTPPNNGVLVPQGPVTLRIVGGRSPGDYPIGSSKALDFDIYYNASTGQNEAYLLEVTPPDANGRSSTNFYSLDLTTRIATQRLSAAGNPTVISQIPFEIGELAIQVVRPAPAGDVQGQLLYALAAGNLISFDSRNPGLLRSIVNFGGGVTAGQTVVGFDFRPLTGELFALGYDAALSTGNAQLYTVSLTSGAATAVGGPLSLALGSAGSAVGFDFNPTVDRLRVTSAGNRANYRLNPITGGLVQRDGELTNDVSAAAYTNNDNDVNTGTTLYGYDQTTNFVVRATDPNAGVYVNQGTGSGITVSAAGVDFDIYTQNSVTNGVTTNVANSAFLVAAPSGTTADNLYTVDLAAGTVNNVGRIGLGGNFTALAAQLTPDPINNNFTGLLTWTGAVSTAWNVAANWTPAFVPTEANDVVIPGTPANQPTVSTAQPVRTVTLNAGAVLTTANGGTLSVGGNFLNNGGAVAGAGTGLIALTGAASQTIGGSSPTTFFNLSIGASGTTLGTTLTSPAAVQRQLTLNGNSNLFTNGQPFTLLSNAQGQGQVVNAGGGGVSGTVTVQRAIEGSRNQDLGYRHYASPVAGAPVSDLNSSTGRGFTAVLNQAYNTSATPRATQPFPNVFGYSQDLLATSIAQDHKFTFDKGFFVPTDAFVAGDPRAGLQPGRGYSVNIAADVSVDFVGALNNGPITVTGLNNSGADGAGFQFLGNPYPSALDWDLVNGVQLDPALYVFKSSGQYTGTYATYINGQGANGGSHVLPLGQGFFVRASGNGGSVSFENTDRLTTYDATPFQRGTADERPTLTLALRTAAGRGEQTVIYFEAGATPAYDARFDAQHLAGPGAPLNLASVGSGAGSGSRLSINGLPALTGADVLVPLAVSAATPGAYTLEVEALQSLPAGYHAYLRDALTGTATALTAQRPLPLPLLDAATPATGRYAVLFTTQAQAQALAAAPAALAQLAGVYPNPAHGAASLVLPAALRGGQATPVQLVNSLGQVVLRRTLAAGAPSVLELPLNGLAPGIYSVRAQTAAGQVVKRLAVD